MLTVGILAGLGPLAGAHFYKRIIELTPALHDQQHIPVLLVSNPDVPSRIDHLSGVGESPVPKLVALAESLVKAGADFLVIPSTTTNAYYAELASCIAAPIIPMIQVVSEEISQHAVHRIGILATTPTRTFRIYEEQFANCGLEAVYPERSEQEKIMAVIARVKAGAKLDDLRETVLESAVQLAKKGVDGILLACTEIPVIFPALQEISMGSKLVSIFNSTDILAKAVIKKARV